MAIPLTNTIYTPSVGKDVHGPSMFIPIGTNKREPALQRQIGRTPSVLRLEEAVEKISWVFRSIRVIYTNIGSVRLKVNRVQKDGTEEPDNSEKAQRLLRIIHRPNSMLAGNDFMEIITMQMNIREAFVWMQFPDGARPRNGVVSLNGKPVEPDHLFVLDASRMHKIHEKESNKLAGWQLRGINPHSFQLWEIIRIGMHNPKDAERGLSPLMPSFNAADVEYATELHDANFFERGARMTGILSLKGDLTIEQRDRIIEELRSLYGGVGNSYELAVLPADATFINLMANAQEMDFAGLRKLSKDKIAGAFGVPPILLADPTDANRANARQQRFMFWHDTLLPMMQDIEEYLNWTLVPQFDSNLRLRFDTSSVMALQEDVTELADAFRRLAIGMKEMVRLQDDGRRVVTIPEARQIIRDSFPTFKLDPKFDDVEFQRSDNGKAQAQAEKAEKGKVDTSEIRRVLLQLKNAAFNRFGRGARTAHNIFPSPETEEMLERLRGNGSGPGNVAALIREKIEGRIYDSKEFVTEDDLISLFSDLEKKLNA